jgi:hypothetical protein
MNYSGFTDQAGNKIYKGDKVIYTTMPDSPDEESYSANIIYENNCFYLLNTHNKKIPLSHSLIDLYGNGYHPLVINKIIEGGDKND